MWTQVVGKIRLCKRARQPLVERSANVRLAAHNFRYALQGSIFEIEFDFIAINC